MGGRGPCYPTDGQPGSVGDIGNVGLHCLCNCVSHSYQLTALLHALLMIEIFTLLSCIVLWLVAWPPCMLVAVLIAVDGLHCLCNCVSHNWQLTALLHALI